MKEIKFIDLFCGIGGIRTGLEKTLKDKEIKSKCMLSSDIKPAAIKTYEINFGEKVFGDINDLKTKDLADFDLLLGGFPCQAFSSAGKRMGFEDTRGTLFFQIARILKDKNPRAFILENVEGLLSHDNGKTIEVITRTLSELGYSVTYKVLNSCNFELAQSRKRIYIVGVKGQINLDAIFDFKKKYNVVIFKNIREFDLPIKKTKLNDILAKEYKNLSFLGGKSIKDKRGGQNNIHSWDISLKGQISQSQKDLINLIVTKRRYKKWAIENGTVWFDGIPLSFEQIKTFIDYNDLLKDLELLVSLGYLKKDYPKDYVIINEKKEKIARKDLPLGYTLTTGKLSFEFNTILDDNSIVPTIVATDASRLGVIEKDGLRKLSGLELKALFGFSSDYQTSHLKESELFDLFGNSVTTNVVQAITENLIKIAFNN